VISLEEGQSMTRTGGHRRACRFDRLQFRLLRTVHERMKHLREPYILLTDKKIVGLQDLVLCSSRCRTGKPC